jgi:hypothetical protein
MVQDDRALIQRMLAEDLLRRADVLDRQGRS